VEQTGGWPLAGRAEELRAIDEALASGSPAGVVLVGEPGVGKTRLVREALARWSATGRHTEWMVATRGTTSIPFGAVSHLLPPGVVPKGNALALMGKVAERFSSRSGPGPNVVGIDDAHLLDEASASLLRQLAARGLVVALASIRGGEPVAPAVMALWKDARRLHVRPLPPAAVDQILDHALAGQIDPITRRRLLRFAAGNPLLLRELLADARESGALAQREGVWCWRGAVPGTARLAELVASRLAALEPGVLRVLEAIACGEPLGLSTLARVADPSAIEAAERSGAAVAERSGNRVYLRLAHPLYGETLRANLPASRARAIWGQLAGVVAEGPMRRRDDTLVVGVWELHSGLVRHPGVLLDAARQAVARFDLGLAERLARAARGAGWGWDADCLLAQILGYQARYAEAVEVLPEAPPADSGQLATWAVTRASILYWGLSQTEEAERTLLAAAGPGRDLAAAAHSWILLFDGRCQSALDTAEAVLDGPEILDGSEASDAAVVWAAMSGAAAAGVLGRLDRALAIAERGRAVADAAAGAAAGKRAGAAADAAAGERPGRLPWARAQVGYGTCYALLAAGRLHRAREVADEGHRAAVASDAAPMAGLWSGLRGIVAKAQGRVADAQAALREAVALLEGIDEYQFARPCLAELAGAAATAGDVPGARAWLARADRHERRVNRLYDPWVELDRAWTEAAAGSLSAAADQARRATRLARAGEQPAFEAVALYDVARLGLAADVCERLNALAGTLKDGFVPVLAAAAGALAADDPDALERAAAEFTEYGHLLLAAEAMAAAARAHRGKGQPARMRTAMEQAAALAVACQGARTPLLDLGGLGSALSRREREVATLAATMPSREVAERLGLSVHTVNNTLARAYAKLGIRTRGELAGVLRNAESDT
jgi:DNA-binding CsgD family transcriptional regulator